MVKIQYLRKDINKYSYSNNKILSESNSTMNNTYFELERFDCLCIYKDIFGFNRKEEK